MHVFHALLVKRTHLLVHAFLRNLALVKILTLLLEFVQFGSRQLLVRIEVLLVKDLGGQHALHKVFQGHDSQKAVATLLHDGQVLRVVCHFF